MEDGVIAFKPTYKQIGKHEVNITVTDDGKNPDSLSSTLTVKFEIKGYIDHSPKTYLHFPENKSIINSLMPTIIWNVTDIDTDTGEITYFVYLSLFKEKVINRDKEVLVCNG